MVSAIGLVNKKIRFGKTLSYAKLKKVDLEFLVNLVGDEERYLKSHMVLKSWDLREFSFLDTLHSKLNLSISP
ncbi:hypothetical protein LOK49_LG06G01448 [Camellia lanceoleosa]|uniref:Uncharacterized protein n=1 Tax=Camellia lanceoleosa TaxID=1840588 RepID=A0ACC0HCR6_9ERIC|nr:hypothetical protein LOK49_LG06G01448 [Camellia lanceoleosa]